MVESQAGNVILPEPLKSNASGAITAYCTPEIIWNVVNSLLAGGISFFSILAATGSINLKMIGISLISAGLAAFLQFKKYWESEQGEYSTKLFNFLNV
jgi:hypothetical protein